MTNALGFLALTLNLTAMAMKGILYLRVLSLVANAIYILYGKNRTLIRLGIYFDGPAEFFSKTFYEV
jgi:hypothetical protein